jgi:predicted AlkP superfamily pyrophosphatase or phosphodiesterase
VRHVVIISEDGMRPDLIYGQQNMVWHEQLYRNGSFSWKARTIRTASTLPSHASMLSGVDVDQHGLTWNTWLKTRGFIRVPTIFQAAEENGMKTAAFVGKPKLRHIMPEGTVGTCSPVLATIVRRSATKRPVTSSANGPSCCLSTSPIRTKPVIPTAG